MILIALWLCATFGIFVATSTYRAASEYATCARYTQMLELNPTVTRCVDLAAHRYVRDAAIRQAVWECGSAKIVIEQGENAGMSVVYHKQGARAVCVTLHNPHGKLLIKYYLRQTHEGVALTFYPPTNS